MKATCSFPGCGARRYVADLCAGHYCQRRKGVPLRPILRTLEQRFWAKVNKTDGCWLWTGATNHLGYGQISIGNRRLDMAHRVSLRMAGVVIPEGYDVDHLCRVRRCVRPDHLEPVTHAENMDRAPWTAIQFQSAKTRCPHGHAYTEANTYLRRNSAGTLSRECRACRRERRSRAA